MLKISIITVVLNDVQHIEYTLQSVLNQNYSNLEYIVIDGGSTDGTVEIIEKYNEKISWWCSESDGGTYDAMNKGVAKSIGDIIGIINSGDFLMPGVLNRVEEKYSENDADILHGNLLRFHEYHEYCTYQILKPDSNLSNLLRKQTIFHPTCFISKELYKKIGLYNTFYKIVADYDFLLRAFECNSHIVHVDKTITGFRAGGVSSRSFQKFIELSKVYWVKKKYWKFIITLIKGLMFKTKIKIASIINYDILLKQKRLSRTKQI